MSPPDGLGALVRHGSRDGPADLPSPRLPASPRAATGALHRIALPGQEPLTARPQRCAGRRHLRRATTGQARGVSDALWRRPVAGRCFRESEPLPATRDAAGGGRDRARWWVRRRHLGKRSAGPTCCPYQDGSSPRIRSRGSTRRPAEAASCQIDKVFPYLGIPTSPTTDRLGTHSVSRRGSAQRSRSDRSMAGSWRRNQPKRPWPLGSAGARESRCARRSSRKAAPSFAGCGGSPASAASPPPRPSRNGLLAPVSRPASVSGAGAQAQRWAAVSLPEVQPRVSSSTAIARDGRQSGRSLVRCTQEAGVQRPWMAESHYSQVGALDPGRPCGAPGREAVAHRLLLGRKPGWRGGERRGAGRARRQSRVPRGRHAARRPVLARQPDSALDWHQPGGVGRWSPCLRRHPRARGGSGGRRVTRAGDVYLSAADKAHQRPGFQGMRGGQLFTPIGRQAMSQGRRIEARAPRARTGGGGPSQRTSGRYRARAKPRGRSSDYHFSRRRGREPLTRRAQPWRHPAGGAR